MAINQDVQRVLTGYENNVGLNNTNGQSSLINYYTDQVNNQLQSDTAYLGNMLKIKQSYNAIMNNSQQARSAINNSTDQLTDAQYSSNQKIAKSGLGNSGLAALQGVDASASNKSIQDNLESTARTNRATLDSMDLYEGANARAILSDIFGNLNQDTKDGNITNIQSQTGATNDDIYGALQGLKNAVHPEMVNDGYDQTKDPKKWEDTLNPSDDEKKKVGTN